MRMLWVFTGRIAYWLSWPLLFVYLQRSERTRVLVACDDEVLLVRGWLGNGRWGLPGGGLHRNELPLAGAMRELREETGIEVSAADLQFLFSRNSVRRHGLSFRIHAYALVLANKPRLSKQKLEITHAKWLAKNELSEHLKTEEEVQTVLEAFYNSQ